MNRPARWRTARALAPALGLVAILWPYQEPAAGPRDRAAGPPVGEGWREVEVEVGLQDHSIGEAVQAAFTVARLEAVVQECGVVFDSLSWTRRPEALRECLGLLERAYVAEERVDAWDAAVDRDRPRVPPDVRLKLRAHMRTSCGAGFAPGDFRVRGSLDALAYRPGDEVFLSVTPSHICHLTVLLFAQDDSVYVAFPNAMQPDRSIASQETVGVPSGIGRRTGLVRIPAPEGPDGGPAKGLVWIVATPEPLRFPPPRPLGQGLACLGSVPAAMRLLAEQLLSRPPPQRAMDSLQIESTGTRRLKTDGAQADP